jgi:hypothetical protein
VQPGLDRPDRDAQVDSCFGLGKPGQVVRLGGLPLARREGADRVFDTPGYLGGFRGLDDPAGRAATYSG